MSKTEQKYQMSKKQKRGNSLPPLQRKIILCLAEHGALTINECVKIIKHHYKATWIAFNSLERKGLIQKVNIKLYRGREYPQFWLSPEGQLTALLNNANIGKVRENALKYCEETEREDFSIFYEIAQSVGPETANKIFRFILEKGKFELSYLPMNEKDVEKIVRILKKYPKYRKTLENVGEKLVEKIKEVLGP
ncbi:MAG: hypothetical protein QXI91_05490 [Candidatus Bathyarchaeia archaeon]